MAAVVAVGVTVGRSTAQSKAAGPVAGMFPVMTIGTQVGFSGNQSAAGELFLAPDSTWSARLLSSGTEPCASEATISASADPDTVNSSTEPEAAVIWKLRARLVAVKEDTATVAVRWSRDVMHAGLVPSDSIVTEREYRLTDGRSGVLDLVTAAPDSKECPSFAVTIGLKFSAMRPQGDAALAYDMWLVQDDGDRGVRTDRFQSVSRDGESLDYFFKPLPYDASGTPTSAVRASGLRLSAAGTLRGTIVNGSIDLLMDGSVAYFAESTGGMTHGRKRLMVHDGETVEFEMPGAPTRDFPEVGSLTALFRRSRTAIRVTPRILWELPAVVR
jgi:hypothetical protein